MYKEMRVGNRERKKRRLTNETGRSPSPSSRRRRPKILVLVLACSAKFPARRKRARMLPSSSPPYINILLRPCLRATMAYFHYACEQRYPFSSFTTVTIGMNLHIHTIRLDSALGIMMVWLGKRLVFVHGFPAF